MSWVVSGCTLGPVACRLRPAGCLIVLQPCDTERRPIGAAVWVGPIRTDDDLTAVRDWIRAGRFAPALLPAHLIAQHHRTRGARQN